MEMQNTNQNMTTKERIVDEALTLFSTKGYKGTSVKDIANAVGIKDSSLYKHFGSKQEIFDAIIGQVYFHMGRLSEDLGMPGDDFDIKVSKAFYKTLDLEGLKVLGRKVFLFYLTDLFISRFWKLAHMEQYQNPEIYQIFHYIFMEKSIDYQTKLFAQMIEFGLIKKTDPSVIAIQFYSPIYFLLSKYAGKSELADEALIFLDKQIEAFYSSFSDF